MAEISQAHAGNQNYDENFYRQITKAAAFSAGQMMPAIKKFLRPKSVIDVGCGGGGWLYVWEKNFVEIFGIDGDYVDRSQLLVDEKFFHPMNLEDKIIIDRRFDLAMTLEVAEHLSPERAESFVEDLTKLSDVVMFSAAIPGQGGTNHVNEQWQSYWAEKFLHHSYVGIDCLRPQIWNNNSISQHYRQNVFIYVKSSELYHYPELQNFYLNHRENMIVDLVHPQVWLNTLIQFQKIYNQLQNSHSRGAEK